MMNGVYKAGVEGRRGRGHPKKVEGRGIMFLSARF